MAELLLKIKGFADWFLHKDYDIFKTSNDMMPRSNSSFIGNTWHIAQIYFLYVPVTDIRFSKCSDFII